MKNDNRSIVINIDKPQRTEAEESVISSIINFLESEQCELMNKCFFSIRNRNNERVFKESIGILDDLEFDMLFPLVSNVIITANKIESDCLNYVISKQLNAYIKKRKHNINIIPDHNVGAADAYIFKMDTFYMLHINAFETGSNTPGGSTDIVRFISNNHFLKPTSIISLGVCYGRDPDKQEIGNVIIPQKLYPWSIGQKIVDKTLKIKNDDFNLWLFSLFDKSKIYSALRDYCNGEDGKTITGSISLVELNSDRMFRIKTTMGNMSTGEAVVSSEDMKEIIVEATGNYKELGGEMEGYGIAKECAYYAHIPCIIIKSICDWGILKNIEDILKEKNIIFPQYLKDKLQSYAAFCSSIVLVDLYHKENELLFSLDFINYIAQSKTGRNILNGNTSFNKTRIINTIRRFYGVDQTKANELLEILIKKKIVVFSSYDSSQFIVDQSSLKELTNHGYY